MILIRGNIVHSTGPEELAVLPEHALLVGTNGVIKYLGPIDDCPQPENMAATAIIDLTPTQFVIPGFVDAHIHASQYPITGIFSDTLLEWLTKYAFPLESRFQSEETAKAVYCKTVARTLQNGTTTASYFGTAHESGTINLAKACLDQGQRALIGRVCMERDCPEELVSSFDADIAFITAVQQLDPTGNLIQPVITPRFAPSCTHETLKGLGKIARENALPVQTHLSENVNEIKLVAKLFPDAENYTDVYFQADLLKEDTILAHSIHLSQKETEVIKLCHSGLVHCPFSNAAICSGIAPIKQYLNKGLKVGLGTDVGGGTTVSILANARLALLMSNLLAERNGGNIKEYSLTIANALYMATLGGASVCGLSQSTGNFAVGKQFDAQLIDISAPGSTIDLFDFQVPEDPLQRLDHLLRKWIYIGDDRNTLQVWISGRAVYGNVVPEAMPQLAVRL